MTVSLERSFQKVSQDLGIGRVAVEFYPYSELKHTWRSVHGTINFRVSDYLEDAPAAVSESLAWYLLSRAERTRCPDGKSAPYRDYCRSKELWESIRPRYLSRSRTLSLEPKGRHRDLAEVFRYVNSFYFGGAVDELLLAWTSESPRHRLGYYFGPLKLLAVNSVLDSESVPRYVLEFVMYHELLHHVAKDDPSVRKRVHHTKAFRELESSFGAFEDAERWLRKIVSHKRRN